MDKIAETPYFSHELNEYLGQLQKVARKILSNHHSLPSNVVELMADQIWTATKFLAGSTSKKIPYEIAHCLKKALASWTHKNALITTALTQDKAFSFYFQGISQDFYSLAKVYTGIEFTSELVQIALPEIYQHRPLLNVALYHELGHFLDTHHGIVTRSLFMTPCERLPLPKIDFINLPPQHRDQIARSHRSEYFADIFAASYAGWAYREFLAEFANNNQVCATHPATEDRLALIDSFLSNKQTDILGVFQDSLSSLNLNKFEIAFAAPKVSKAFDNVRPYEIQSESELHGIFEASSIYLRQMLVAPSGPWIETGEADRERMINNLVEKSIRNSMILDRWRNYEATA